MVRKLALAVSLALGTASVPVYALGLGELSSKSLLNQNFEGNIGLMSVKPDELEAVRVKLGDTEAFSRAGVERPFYLSLLKFEPLVTSGGKPVIRVTSDFPIREPFLNFLIEVNWPKGRLLREYTVLLDPPTTTARRAPSVTPAKRTNIVATKPAVTQPEARTQPVAPIASVTPTASVDAAPADALVGDASEYGPVKANDTAWSLAKELRPDGVSMEQMMMALLAANPQAFIDGDINRLRRGQILRLPNQDEIRELSRQQARAAYRRQQDDWLARRDEKLQKAAEQAAIDALPGDNATSVEGQATADRLRLATSRPDVEGQAGAGDGESGTPTAQGLQSRLILARENAETSRQETVTLRSQVDDLQARLADMQKLLSLKDEQLAQLQDRVVTDELGAAKAPMSPAEVAPEDAEAIAAGDVSSEDLMPSIDFETDAEVILDAEDISTASQVESDLSEVGDAAGETVEGLSDVEVASSQVDSAADDDVVVFDDEASAISIDEGQDGSIAIETEAGESFADESLEGVPSGPESTATGEPAAAQTDAAVDETEATPPTVSESDSARQEAERGGLLPQPLARVLEEHTLPIAAGGAGLIALIAGFLFARRRRSSDEPEPLLAGIDQDTAAPPAEADTAIAAAEEVTAAQARPADEGTQEGLADSAFLDEFSPSDINALQDETGEVDPVSEADVYIAYGRYQQAEELLGQAMEQDQGRLALKHKLLEVHYATRNTEAYCDLAELMVDAGQDAADEEAWARTREMGRELAPDNELFALKDGETELNLDLGAIGAAAAATTAVAAAVDADSLMLDESELTELAAAYDDDANTANDRDASSDADVSILLDLEDASELVELNEIDSQDSISISTGELESMEFQLPEVEKDGISEDKAAADDSSTDTLDLDSMMAEAEAAVDRADSSSTLDSDFSADDLQAQLDELSDLSVLDSELGDPTKQGAAAPGGLGLVSEDAGPVVNSGLDAPLDLDAAFDAAEETGGLDSIAAAEFGGDDSVSGAGEDISTKLDLARAYVEIGDDDGARSILAEVVAEGNDSQRGDAKQLLSSLG